MQCKSLDVCRGKMSLCAFTIMCVRACVCVCVKGRDVEAACVCPGETDTLALNPTPHERMNNS